jgi:hypothetical protein
MRRAAVAIVAVGRQLLLAIYCECVYSLSYPACKMNSLYDIFICVLSGSTAFLRMISETARFSEKNLWDIECFFLIISKTLDHYLF